MSTERPIKITSEIRRLIEAIPEDAKGILTTKWITECEWRAAIDEPGRWTAIYKGAPVAVVQEVSPIGELFALSVGGRALEMKFGTFSSAEEAAIRFVDGIYSCVKAWTGSQDLKDGDPK